MGHANHYVETVLVDLMPVACARFVIHRKPDAKAKTTRGERWRRQGPNSHSVR